jgi:hypothetical protein
MRHVQPYTGPVSNRHTPLIARLREALLEGKGELPPPARRAAAGLGEELPPEARPLIEKIHHHAYKVTPEDYEALKRAGWSEDQLFELVLSASLGAGLVRLAAAERALEGGASCISPPSSRATGSSSG